MERKALETGPAEIATPQQVRGMRALYKQRLRDQMEPLIAAFEAIDAPKDHTGVERAAKAMIAIDRAVEQIFADEASGEDEMNADTTGGIDAVDAWREILEHKLARLTERRRAAGLDVDLAFDPADLTRQVEDRAKALSGSARR